MKSLPGRCTPNGLCAGQEARTACTTASGKRIRRAASPSQPSSRVLLIGEKKLCIR